MTGPHRLFTGDQAWRDRASCIDTPRKLWFPTGNGAQVQALTEEAKAICRRCPVIASCLADAVATDGWEAFGIRAGLTADERNERRKRRSA